MDNISRARNKLTMQSTGRITVVAVFAKNKKPQKQRQPTRQCLRRYTFYQSYGVA